MDERPAPTPAAKRCLKAIKAIQRRGDHPSIGKLCEALGRKSHAVRCALAILQRDGWIRRDEHQPGVGRRIEVQG